MKTCPECATEHERKGDFCADRCRKAFNNRRAMRGAVLYDYFMEKRLNRKRGIDLGVDTAMSRLAADWRDEDERAGRVTHTDPARHLELNVWLKS